MTTDTKTNRELAAAYVTAYVANLPHNEEAEEIERRGVTPDAIKDALGDLAYEGLVEAMDEDALDAATEAATDRLAALMPV